MVIKAKATCGVLSGRALRVVVLVGVEFEGVAGLDTQPTHRKEFRDVRDKLSTLIDSTIGLISSSAQSWLGKANLERQVGRHADRDEDQERPLGLLVARH